jgi:hypothetical protein
MDNNFHTEAFLKFLPLYNNSFTGGIAPFFSLVTDKQIEASILAAMGKLLISKSKFSDCLRVSGNINWNERTVQQVKLLTDEIHSESINVIKLTESAFQHNQDISTNFSLVAKSFVGFYDLMSQHLQYLEESFTQKSEKQGFFKRLFG